MAIVGPADDVAPLVVAVADGRAKRLLGDDLRQNDVIVRVRGAQARGIEAGGIGREGIAAAGLIGLVGLVRGREGHRLVLHVVGPEVVGEVELGRGALLGADRLAVQLLGRGDAELLADHEALAVEVVDGREVEAELRVARHGRGRVAGQHVHLARLERGEAVLGGERNEAHLGRVVEDGGRDGAAEIDVETGPVALGIRAGRSRREPLFEPQVRKPFCFTLLSVAWAEAPVASRLTITPKAIDPRAFRMTAPPFPEYRLNDSQVGLAVGRVRPHP